MAITGTFILEILLKWLIPFICLAVVSLITARLVNPYKKGNRQERIEEWENLANSSSLHKTFERQINFLEKNYQRVDEEIIKRLDAIQEQDKINREELKKHNEQVDIQLSLLREGVLETHLTNLIYTAQNFIDQGYITPAELDRYNQGYHLYKKLGGNGHMDYWHAQVMKLPHKNEMTHNINNKEYKNRGDS